MANAISPFACADLLVPDTIQRRAIFFIGGYDPKSPDAFFTRLEREAARSGKVWAFDVAQDGAAEPKAHHTMQPYRTSGDGWETRTDFHFVHLDDIVLADFHRSLLTRMGRYVVTAADYFVTGTAFKFFRHAWRFALYFLYPLVMFLLALAASFGGARVAEQFGAPLLAQGLAALAVFTLLVRVVFKRWFVLHLMDLWSFSRDFVRGRRDDIEIKLDAVADYAAALKGYDEVLFIGHSTGGALVLSLAARARERGLTGERLTVLTVGSTALKIGLHPAAKTFREQVAALVADPAWDWAEYQSLTDIINFDKTDPAALMGAGGHGKPVVNRVRMKAMVDAPTYKRMKGNFFRMHYQFVFGNSKPYHYDFPAICFGPAPLMERARHPERFDQP